VPSCLKIMPRVSARPFLRARGILPHKAAIRRRGTGDETTSRIEVAGIRALVEQGAAVARHRRIEQREVRRIGQRAHMQRRIVRQFRRGADPDIDAAVVDLLAEK